jgi:hypothetical protein
MLSKGKKQGKFQQASRVCSFFYSSTQWRAHRGESPRPEEEEFFQGMKMRSLAGHDLFDASFHPRVGIIPAKMMLK